MKGTTSDARTEVQVRPELFVAYAESDSEWVHGFFLPELGLDPQSVLTPQDFRPGAVVVQELERAVETARLTVLVLSPAFGMSPWSAFAELLEDRKGRWGHGHGQHGSEPRRRGAGR